MVDIFLILKKLSNSYPKCLHPFKFPKTVLRVPATSHGQTSSLTLGIFDL